MNYYIIRNSLNEKILGVYYQATSAKHNCDVWNEPRFIQHTNLEEITFEPIISNAIISPKAKLTDLISSTSIGFTRRLLISGKFKHVLEQNVLSGIQFFSAPVIYKGDILKDYWLLNAYPPQTEKIDFNKSIIISRRKKEGGGTYVVEEKFSSYDEFKSTTDYFWKNKVGQVLIRTIVFREEVKEDFLVIDNTEGGVSYVVSEHLKNEIEKAGCTGIEFQPTTISRSDWLGPNGGERAKVYESIN